MNRENREFARIEVAIPARVRPLEPAEAARLCEETRTSASVWAPRGEKALQDMVSGSLGSTEAVLAQALLDCTAQLVRLRTAVLSAPDRMAAVELDQLSGGGGRIRASLPLKMDDLLELLLEGDDDMPPLRAVIRIVHRTDGPDTAWCGFRFEAIHADDQERLIRVIYGLQRRALRMANDGAG